MKEYLRQFPEAELLTYLDVKNVLMEAELLTYLDVKNVLMERYGS